MDRERWGWVVMGLDVGSPGLIGWFPCLGIALPGVCLALGLPPLPPLGVGLGLLWVPTLACGWPLASLGSLVPVWCPFPGRGSLLASSWVPCPLARLPSFPLSLWVLGLPFASWWVPFPLARSLPLWVPLVCPPCRVGGLSSLPPVFFLLGPSSLDRWWGLLWGSNL
jgi:hypothetical protein